jgi:hypothetical protein
VIGYLTFPVMVIIIGAAPFSYYGTSYLSKALLN